MSKREQQKKARELRINKVLDAARDALNKEGVKYLLAVVDKDPKATDGGKVFVNMDIAGTEFIHILDVAMPTNQDITNLGIYVGQLIQARLKDRKQQTLKGA